MNAFGSDGWVNAGVVRLPGPRGAGPLAEVAAGLVVAFGGFLLFSLAALAMGLVAGVLNAL